jgi:hypothetical protein
MKDLLKLYLTDCFFKLMWVMIIIKGGDWFHEVCFEAVNYFRRVVTVSLDAFGTVHLQNNASKRLSFESLNHSSPNSLPVLSDSPLLFNRQLISTFVETILTWHIGYSTHNTHIHSKYYYM